MKLPWKPWHDVVELREELKSGDLTLAMFAADLHDVVLQQAKPVYQDSGEFFSQTYPTYNLRELARDVVGRLAGENDRAVRQLELTYGGGKTHALITLYHLVNQPDALPDVPAVNEFKEHIGTSLPEARISTLTFDKLDEKKGMKVLSPDGQKTGWLYPWTIMAWQLAGERGLEALGMDGGVERETQPAENVIRDILEIPLEDGLAPLVLIDEVLMWARTMVGLDQVWRQRLQDFFQCLTQAATKVERCAIVASLLATDPGKSDDLGRGIVGSLFDVFARESEEAVEPVVKEDVAEVLRRRLFTPESIGNREQFRPSAMAALKGIAEVDEHTRKNMKTEEERYVSSYPFHPDLTEVFYTKWTSLSRFQRTRGVLKTFALALRSAANWDDSPLVGPNVFLSPPDTGELSAAARELTSIASKETYHGQHPDWSPILEGELAKARDVQDDFASLRYREVEQAVLATFLHSQPIGRRAKTQELFVLLGATRPDQIDLGKALQGWADRSWFLDEAVVEAADEELPSEWRLGPEPNLTQIHHEARRNVPEDVVESELLDEIGSTDRLTANARGAGAVVHKLPTGPRDITDDGQFHYAVLGPKAASEPGKPSELAQKYLEQTTGSDRPRVYKNAVVLAVPSRSRLDAARGQMRDRLGWEQVQDQMKDQELGPVREKRLKNSLSTARKKVRNALEQAYCIVVTMSREGEVEAFRVTIKEGQPLFNLIKADEGSRIQDTPVNAEAMLPGGPYDLWQEGEKSRRFQDLVGAFAQLPHLPKMLKRDEILGTLIQGAVNGLFVLRSVRPDGSERTFWMEQPDEAARGESGLEVVLPEAAKLAEIKPDLLEPGALPELWHDTELTVGELCDYFSGDNVVQVERNGYEEPLTIPEAPQEVVFAAVARAVEQGRLWLTSGTASICGEEIPAGVLTPKSVLQSPPAPIPVSDLLPEQVPEAWEDEKTTAHALATALSQRLGKELPWGTVRQAIQGALQARQIELADDSGPWPCEYDGAKQVKLQLRKDVPPPPPPPPRPGVRTAEAELTAAQIQDLADRIGEIQKLSVGHDFKLRLHLEVGDNPSDETVTKLNKLLDDISDDLHLG